MSKGTPKRSVRVDDPLWDRAKVVAATRGDDLSAILRRALEKYVEDNQEEQA